MFEPFKKVEKNAKQTKKNTSRDNDFRVVWHVIAPLHTHRSSSSLFVGISYANNKYSSIWSLSLSSPVFVVDPSNAYLFSVAFRIRRPKMKISLALHAFQNASRAASFHSLACAALNTHTHTFASFDAVSI